MGILKKLQRLGEGVTVKSEVEDCRERKGIIGISRVGSVMLFS